MSARLRKRATPGVRRGRRQLPRSSSTDSVGVNIPDTETQTSSEPVNKDRHVEGSVRSIPVYRRLRCYAFDPSLSVRLDTAVINETIYKISWEDRSEEADEGLMPGPVGEYLEIVD